MNNALTNRIGSWLRLLIAGAVALVLGCGILCMMKRTLSENNPSAIPATVIKQEQPVFTSTNKSTGGEPAETKPGLLTIETHSEAPRVWALGVTLAAEVLTLALVLLVAVRIARED